MSLPLISVIIPVYNTSRSLSRCLESVARQDYENLEIIIVNDASTDNSLQICRKFAEKDRRIKIINKDVNEGLELARRTGLAVATGEYIFHVDSDDWLANSKVLSRMCEIAEKTDADFVQIQAKRTIDKFGFIKKKLQDKNIKGLIEQPELFDKYFISFFGKCLLQVHIWGKLYRKSLLDKIDIMPLSIKTGEDLVFNMQVFPHLTKIYIMDEVGYYYQFGGMTSGFMPTLLSDAKKIQRFRDYMIVKYNYEKAHRVYKKDFIAVVSADIRQRIRYNHRKEDIIKHLRQEISDPIYEAIIEFYNKSTDWNDPFVSAIADKDVEKMYEICYKNERKLRWRRKLLKGIYRLLR